jgi:hypothetical protein
MLRFSRTEDLAERQQRNNPMSDLDSEKGELSEAELNAVTGGSAVDTVVDVAKNVWNILTKPLPGVRGESMDSKHRD